MVMFIKYDYLMLCNLSKTRSNKETTFNKLLKAILDSYFKVIKLYKCIL